MKFSTIAALCAAPLALASSLNVELVEKRDSVTITEVVVIWINKGGVATTQTVNTLAAVSTGAVAAATHTVVVGGAAGLVYVPDTISAAIGDMVIFEFMSANHTVTESAFAAPCVKQSATAFDSGFMPNANNTVVPAPALAFQVTVSTPLWFYCKQKGHCGKGMVFSINPTAAKSQAAFAALAVAQNGTVAAAPVATSVSSSAAGTLATAIIVGGAGSGSASASTVSIDAAPAATSSAGGVVAGTGTLSSEGACACSCLCGAAAFPAAGQGLAAFGGLPGAMPQSALMA